MNKSIKLVLKICTAICIIMVFLPIFNISIGNTKLELPIMTLIGGLTIGGYDIIPSQHFFIVLLAMPIVAFVMLFIDSINEKLSNLIMLICLSIDFLSWIIIRFYVGRNFASFYSQLMGSSGINSYIDFFKNEKISQFNSSIFFWINIIILMICILLLILIVTNKLSLNDNYDKAFSSIKNMGQNMSQNLSSLNKTHSTDYKRCPKCGTMMDMDALFCNKCGTKYPIQTNEKNNNVNFTEEVEHGINLNKVNPKDSNAVEHGINLNKANPTSNNLDTYINNSNSDNMSESSNIENNSPLNNLDTTNKVTERVCPNCGYVINGDAIFCRKCGTKID